MPYSDPAKQRAYQAARAAKRREAWIRKMGGACAKCGDVEALELDHVTPTEKVSHRIWSWSDKRIAEEVGKCQLLCAACHKEKTKVELSKPLVHGTRHGYDGHRCRCAMCKDAKREAIAAWRLRVGGRKAKNRCAMEQFGSSPGS